MKNTQKKNHAHTKTLKYLIIFRNVPFFESVVTHTFSSWQQLFQCLFVVNNLNLILVHVF